MSGSDKPTLIVVCGATASGKTSLSIQLAKALNCPILSFDSRQFYREMNIGTAKPTAEELSQAEHLFINNRSIHDPIYTAGMFELEALETLNRVFQDHDSCIAVGGSGLYIDALCFGIDDIPKDEDVRASLEQELETEGLEKLQKELQECDPEYFKEADIQNPRRIMRALEVYRQTGKKYSSFRQQEKKERPFDTIWVALDWEREELFDRINRRVDQMLEEGLLDEVKGLIEYRELKSLKTVGYRELFEYLDEDVSLEQAIHNLKRNTRNYAKKQIGWFKRNEEVQWIKPAEIADFVLRIARNLSK